ncbi:sugar-binding transcriptional regulator [Streptantibioticus ferralitis]|uniref:Sugar-binding domain-containing protein n=1 Tax=Streptantibioticus ferralitis TaxID=236510 RepID=A0ABT5ZBB6_9ACTN|nr:sugar-binding domain-containing protein [Streptantibioticus ferralitis]MDF2261146.1 sugar-binding domain-containing protein [Streptantibioticus ferralitis]
MSTRDKARAGARPHHAGPEELVQTAAMARRFYLDGKSKIEIAEEFGISRFKVARTLETAIRDGLIRLEIRLPPELDAERSDALRTRYGLSHAIVFTSQVQDPGGAALVTRRLGAVAAGLLAEIVTEDDVLGLIWGPEIEALGPELTTLARCTVVQLCGVTPLRPVDANAVEAVRRAAAVSRGVAYPIYAPLLLPDGATARMLRRQPGIVEAVGRFSQVTKAVITVGAWGPELSTIYDALSDAERENYRSQGACAEVSGHLLDGEGRIVAPELTERIIAISFEELRRVPDVILLADGSQRAAATAAALKTGLFNGIVTDTGVAEYLLA